MSVGVNAPSGLREPPPALLSGHCAQARRRTGGGGAAPVFMRAARPTVVVLPISRFGKDWQSQECAR